MNRPWDGKGVWSSYPCKSPQQANLESFREVLCLMHWDERLVTAFRRALQSYNKAGRPGCPILSVDYRRKFKDGKFK